MPIHLAITRRVRPGCEAAFQQELRAFLQTSFDHGGVWGAGMLTPLPGSDSREYGVMRTFADEKERDAFYESPMFKTWDERARALTEGEPEYRSLHGLEAWFRSPHQPPPLWKMAIATFVGVFPVTMILDFALGPMIRSWHFVLGNAVFNACVVICLTWLVMPLVTRLLHGWLNPQPQQKDTTS